MGHVNHKLESGMELVVEDDAELGGITTRWQVTSIDSDGAVNVLLLEGPDDGRSETDTWSHESVVTGLQHGELKDSDGRSHELVKHF